MFSSSPLLLLFSSRMVVSGMQPVGRRSLLLGASGVALPVFAEETAGERLRKAASVLPGLGPPDVLYPLIFKGRWILRRQVVNVTRVDSPFPLDEQSTTCAARFVDYGDSEHVVADRGFNAEKLALARKDPFRKAAWDPSNPNVLSLEDNDNNVLERKVTKRSFEAPSQNTFGSSEYARIALARGRIPQIFAERTRTKWRWNEKDLIEGIEIASLYDPQRGGDDDPIRVLKTRLSLTRESV